MSPAPAETEAAATAPAAWAAVGIEQIPLARTRALRQAVLRPDLSTEELAAHEPEGSVAFGALVEGRLVGVGLVGRDGGPGDWRVRGMATEPEFRGRGLGREVLLALVRFAAGAGARRVWCNARLPALSLYTRAGFAVVSDPFELPAIGPHRVVELLLGARRGVLALGDSITNGGGGLQWGVGMRSWAEWTARGLGLAYTGLATDGARAPDVLGQQLARHARLYGEFARYDLGCLYVGVNDVRRPDWNAAAFAGAYRQVLEWLAARCDRVLGVTAPLDLGRPRAGEAVLELNDVVRRAVSAAGGELLDLSELRARNLVMSDHVHLTALGQVWVAKRALEALSASAPPASGAGAPRPHAPGAGGAPGSLLIVREWPSAMIAPESTAGERLRADLGYAWRSLKQRLGAFRPRA